MRARPELLVGGFEFIPDLEKLRQAEADRSRLEGEIAPAPIRPGGDQDAVSRHKDPRIDPAHPDLHPRRYVSIRVAAEYLEEPPRTVAAWLDDGTLPTHRCGRHGLRRKIPLAAVIAFGRQRAS